MRNLLILLSLLIVGCAGGPATKSGAEFSGLVRAAFDIGSGATKMKVGRISEGDKAPKVEILFPTPSDNGETKVAYQDALKASGNDTLPESIIESGISEIKKLKAIAEGYQAKEFVGVATSAFRKAKNGQAAIERIAKETGVNLKIISQEEEANLGFWGAVGVTGQDPAKLLVWDIGGGSQQLSYLETNGGTQGSNNSVGSDVLKEKVREIQRRKAGISVNPVGKNAAKKALAWVRAEAKKVTAEVKKRAKNPEYRIIGIGSVHSISLKEQAMTPEDKYYDQGMVKRALEASWDLTDEKFNSKYAENQVPNLILVLGFMEQLGITDVTPVRVNLADGLLRYSPVNIPAQSPAK